MVCQSENMQNNEPIRTSSVIGLCRVDLSAKSISSLSLAENPQFLELLQNLGLRIIDFDDKSALCWPITLKIRILVLFAYIFRWTYNLLYLGITVESCKLESSNISDYHNFLKDQLSAWTAINSCKCMNYSKYSDIITAELLGNRAKDWTLQCNDIKSSRWIAQSRVSGLISDS